MRLNRLTQVIPFSRTTSYSTFSQLAHAIFLIGTMEVKIKPLKKNNGNLIFLVVGSILILHVYIWILTHALSERTITLEANSFIHNFQIQSIFKKSVAVCISQTSSLNRPTAPAARETLMPVPFCRFPLLRQNGTEIEVDAHGITNRNSFFNPEL